MSSDFFYGNVRLAVSVFIFLRRFFCKTKQCLSFQTSVSYVKGNLYN